MIATRTTHEPLPEYALDTKVQHTERIDPDTAGEDFQQAPTWVGEESFVGILQVVEVGGFHSCADVNVAEDVEARLNAPEFTEETGTA